jgi:diacylglycerol O-acyltransferase-1
MMYGLLLSVPTISGLNQTSTCSPGGGIFENVCTPAVESPWAVPKPIEALLSWVLSTWAVYIVEYCAANDILTSETLTSAIHVVLSICSVVLPILWTWRSKAEPAMLIVYMFQSVIMWMKLISYVHCNRDLRITWRKTRNIESPRSGFTASEKQLSDIFTDVKDLEAPYITYPNNINIPNMLYFCVAPTLNYQLNYPRSPKIRWRYVLTIVARLVATLIIVTFSIQQYIGPTLAASYSAMQNKNVMQIGETLLKLCIPNSYIWLLLFYFYFHLWLNLLAELTRFGDRAFYREWWNARTIEEYWRNWNLPVHYWMVRHFCKYSGQCEYTYGCGYGYGYG